MDERRIRDDSDREVDSCPSEPRGTRELRGEIPQAVNLEAFSDPSAHGRDGRPHAVARRLCSAGGAARSRATPTVYTNGHPAQRRWVPFMYFLHEAGSRLPRGATVLLVQPGGTDRWTLEYRWLLAEAELPDQNVVPVTAAQIEARSRALAPFAVDDSGQGPDLAGYRLLERFPGGTLFVRR